MCAACTSLTVFTVSVVAPEVRAQTVRLASGSNAPTITGNELDFRISFTGGNAVGLEIEDFQFEGAMADDGSRISRTGFNFADIDDIPITDSGPIFITIPAGSFTNRTSGQPTQGLARTQLAAGITLGSAGPTPVIALAPGETVSRTQPFDIRIEFFRVEGSERFPTRVMGFGEDDFTVTNGSVMAGSLEVVSTAQLPGSVYQATIMPSVPQGETLSVMIAANTLQDLVSRNNLASETFSPNLPTPGPFLTLNNPRSEDDPVLQQPSLTTSFTPSENIASPFTNPRCNPLDELQASDFTIENGTLVLGQLIPGQTVITGRFDAADSGPAYISLPAGSFQAADDCADSEEFPRTFVGRFNLGAPRPVISLAPGAAVSFTAPFNIRIEFFVTVNGVQRSTAVTGFALDDFTATNGTVSSLMAVSGSVYEATITPSGGAPTVMIAAGTVENLAGTANTASNAFSPMEGELVISDSNLRRMLVAQGVGTGSAENSVLVSDLEDLTELRANGQGITDITGLEHATSLNTLTLAGNEIRDFSPLMNLDTTAELAASEDGALRRLNLANTGISDLNVLSNLTALTSLKLQRNNITSLDGLPILGQIKRLKLNENEIKDISLLVRSGMGWGENDHLDLRENPLNEDAYTTHIRTLLDLMTNGDVLFGRSTASVALIPDPKLRRLVAASVDVSPRLIQAFDLDRLTELRANGQGIRCLTGLQHATNLEVLTLAGNALPNATSDDCAHNFTVLSGLTSLRVLNLSNTGINNLSGVLPDSNNLAVLKLLRNDISGFPTDLPFLRGIRRMKLNDNNIRNIGQLLNISWDAGDFLDLRGNPLSSTARGHASIIESTRGGVTVLIDPPTSPLVTGTTTQGDVAISIAALEPSVIEGTSAQFQLTAAPAPTNDLVVAIEVADPHGVLTNTPPTQVTIEANQTTFTLELETDDDDIDELNATVTVTLEESADNRYTVAAAPDNSASIIVMDNDGLTQERREEGIEHALGAFGRAAGWDLVEAIRNRSHNSTVQAKGFEITNLPTFGVINMGTPGTSIETSSIDLSRLLNSEVKIAFNPQVAQASESGSSGKSPLVRAWVNASRSDVESNPFEGRTQEGELTIGRFGIDAAYSSGWLVGSVFSWHDGNIEFDDTDFDTSGEVGIDLLSINPYVSYTKDKLHLWGTIGGGFGDLSYEDSPGGRTTSTDSDLRMLTAAAGAEYEFGQFGPFDLKGRGEGMVVNLDAEDSSHALVGYDDIGVTVYGARGELELGLPLQLENNQKLRPYVFTGLRQDGGLGNDLVLEYGGGFALSTGSLVAEGTIRSQSSSEDDAVELRGYSISLAYDRGNDRKGLVAKVGRSAGPSGYDPYGVALSSLSSSTARTSSRVHVGYGIGLDENLLRPFVAMGWGESEESELDLGLEYQYSNGRAILVYSGGDGSNLRFRFQKLF